jgi:hypothetical protein
VGADFDEEIRRILALLSQRVEDASDSDDGTKDLAFLESVVARLKDVQNRYSHRWRAIKE